MPFLPSLTTTKPERVGQFLEDVHRLEIRALALFPTTFNPKQRQALYRDLETVPELQIPHVHLRSDFSDAEIDYLVQRFQSQVFNLHPAQSQFPPRLESDRWKKQTFLENSDALPEIEELNEYAGLCLDFAHWENGRVKNDPRYQGFEALVRAFPVGCCHISAIRPQQPNSWSGGIDHHSFNHLSELDYLLRYRAFLPKPWASLELENSLAQQLAAISYLEAGLRSEA